MIKSMTGFGRSTYENEGREYIVEIKSVNNRFTDINIKMPRNLNYLEEKIRKQILSNISRGKVEVSIQLNNNSDLGKKINLNTDIAKKYVEELKEIIRRNKYNRQHKYYGCCKISRRFKYKNR